MHQILVWYLISKNFLHSSLQKDYFCSNHCLLYNCYNLIGFVQHIFWCSKMAFHLKKVVLYHTFVPLPSCLECFLPLLGNRTFSLFPYISKLFQINLFSQILWAVLNIDDPPTQKLTFGWHLGVRVSWEIVKIKHFPYRLCSLKLK